MHAVPASRLHILTGRGRPTGTDCGFLVSVCCSFLARERVPRLGSVALLGSVDPSVAPRFRIDPRRLSLVTKLLPIPPFVDPFAEEVARKQAFPPARAPGVHLPAAGRSARTGGRCIPRYSLLCSSGSRRASKSQITPPRVLGDWIWQSHVLGQCDCSKLRQIAICKVGRKVYSDIRDANLHLQWTKPCSNNGFVIVSWLI